MTGMIVEVIAGVTIAGLAGLAGWVLAIHGRAAGAEARLDTAHQAVTETKGRLTIMEGICSTRGAACASLHTRVEYLVHSHDELKEDIRSIRDYLLQETAAPGYTFTPEESDEL